MVIAKDQNSVFLLAAGEKKVFRGGATEKKVFSGSTETPLRMRAGCAAGRYTRSGISVAHALTR